MVHDLGLPDVDDHPKRPSPVTRPQAPVERHEDPVIAATGSEVVASRVTGDHDEVLAPAGALWATPRLIRDAITAVATTSRNDVTVVRMVIIFTTSPRSLLFDNRIPCVTRKCRGLARRSTTAVRESVRSTPKFSVKSASKCSLPTILFASVNRPRQNSRSAVDLPTKPPKSRITNVSTSSGESHVDWARHHGAGCDEQRG